MQNVPQLPSSTVAEVVIIHKHSKTELEHKGKQENGCTQNSIISMLYDKKDFFELMNMSFPWPKPFCCSKTSSVPK